MDALVPHCRTHGKVFFCFFFKIIDFLKYFDQKKPFESTHNPRGGGTQFADLFGNPLQFQGFPGKIDEASLLVHHPRRARDHA